MGRHTIIPVLFYLTVSCSPVLYAMEEEGLTGMEFEEAFKILDQEDKEDKKTIAVLGSIKIEEYEQIKKQFSDREKWLEELKNKKNERAHYVEQMLENLEKCNPENHSAINQRIELCKVKLTELGKAITESIQTCFLKVLKKEEQESRKLQSLINKIKNTEDKLEKTRGDLLVREEEMEYISSMPEEKKEEAILLLTKNLLVCEKPHYPSVFRWG